MTIYAFPHDMRSVEDKIDDDKRERHERGDCTADCDHCEADRIRAAESNGG